MMNTYFRAALGIAAASVLLASTASANLLSNAGFEDPPFAGVEQGGAGSGWIGFGGTNFRVQCKAPGPNCAPIFGGNGAVEGTVALKTFGGGGVYQDFAASAGQVYAGSVQALNPDVGGDGFDGSSLALLLIIFLDGAGADLGATAAAAGTIDNLAPGIWTELSTTATAPVGTATVRFQLMHADGAGAVRFDAASLQVVPIPAAVWLMGSGLLGLLGLRRKRA